MPHVPLTVWPAHPKPKEGELLSSWITRLARANHLTTTDFAKAVLSDERTTLKEIDRTYSPEMMQALADGTGVPLEQVWETSLLSEEGYVFSYRAYGTTEWISPTAAINGSDGKGMAYCPQCLGSDVDPYYRKTWRFIFNPVCPSHRTFLQHGCPQCGKPYNFFYASASHPTMANPIVTCRWCNADVSHGQSQQDSSLTDHVLRIQEKLNAGIAQGSFTVPQIGAIRAQPYLKVLHACMSSLTIPARARWVARNHSEDLPKGIDVSVLDRNDYAHVIEQRTPEEIGVLLCLAWTVMRDWPDRFMRYSGKHEISQYSFFPGRNIPYWVTQTAHEFCLTKGGGISEVEIEAARKLLRKKLGRPETGKELQLFMAHGKVRNLIKASREELKQAELSTEHFELRPSGPGEPLPQRKPYWWGKLIERVSAEQLAKIAILRKPDHKPVPDPNTQLDLFSEKSAQTTKSPTTNRSG